MKTSTAQSLPPILLSHKIQTREDLITFVHQIEHCLQLLFTSTHPEKKVLDHLPESVAKLIPIQVQQSQKLLDEWLKNLLEQVRNMPMVTITIAYLPTVAEAHELITTLRGGFNSAVVVDLQHDAQILAGIRITYGTQRIQYSLQQELVETIASLDVVADPLTMSPNKGTDA